MGFLLFCDAWSLYYHLTTQEFRRLAALYGLQVISIPISEHHPIYCADDIEIWEVRRQSTSLDYPCDDSTASSGVQQAALRVMSWGAVAEVEVHLGRPRRSVRLSQKVGLGGMIGCTLWISSIYITK
jgi:hypothetical protein